MIDLARNDTAAEPVQHIPFMLGLRDAAKQTGLSYYYLRHLCLDNKVAHIRAGRNFKINMDALIAMISTVPDTAAEQKGA